MKIIELRAENFARLKAIEIRPSGSLVQVTGKNSQGKTSVLKSIWTLLEGKAAAPAVPIRKGADECVIYGDLGEYRITRTIRKRDGGDGEVWELKVVTADGSRITKTPQAVIDAFLGDIAFDPLGWTRLPAKDQAEALKSLVDYDFDAAAKIRMTLFAKRTDANRRGRDALAAANQIELPPGPKPLPVDISAMIDDFQRSAEHNAQILREMAERDRLKAEANQWLDEAEGLRARAATMEQRAEKQLEAVGKRPKLARKINTDALRTEIANAEAAKAIIEQFDRRKMLADAANADAKASQEWTREIERIDREAHDAIANAELPVNDLSLGDDEVLLNGLPLAQAGTAEKIEAALAIAMAKNPKLRVILVDEGSELDSDAMKFVADIANKHDFQIWMARVDESGDVGFVISDGEVAQ